MSLEQFERALTGQRPFASDRVSEPRLLHPDVEEIHARDFERLIRRTREVTSQQVGRGVTILGDVGVGKSHLLGRFYRWSTSPPGATAVFLHNLLVAPERMPRYLLASTIGVLTGAGYDYGDCPFYDLWETAIRKMNNLAPEASIDHQTAKDAIDGLVDTSRPLDKAIRQVLLKVGLNMHHAHLEEPNVNRGLLGAGLDWLAGENLDPERADLLGLSSDSEIREGLRDEQDIEHVFRTLAYLSSLAGRPLILCVDQFDNLSESQVRAITRFFHVLIDHVPNLLCVLSGVSDNVLRLLDSEVIPSANWDRVAEERIDLRLVEPKLALRVIQGRIDEFREHFRNLPEIQALVEREPLFPLRRKTFERKIGNAPRIRPRQLIRWAREAWDAEVERCRTSGIARWLADWPSPGENGPNPDPKLWERLVEEVIESKRRHEHQHRLDNPGSLPANASNQEELLRRMIGLAASHRQFGVDRIESAPQGAGCQLHLTSRTGRITGVALVVTTDARRSTTALRRLARGSDGSTRLVLVEDRRRPIKRTDRALEYLESLEGLGSGFAHFYLDLDTHAQLDALVSVLLQARSGDIEVDWKGETRTITEDEALEAFVRVRALECVPLLADLVEPLDSDNGPSHGSGPSKSGAQGHAATENGDRGTLAEPPTSRAPDDAEFSRFLMSLVEVWPHVSVETAAKIWCRENRVVEDEGRVVTKLAEAGQRLSLTGHATVLKIGGSLTIARVGLWPSALLYLLGLHAAASS